MGNFSTREHCLKTAETAIVRSTVLDDAPALSLQRKAVLAEGEFMVTCPEEYAFTDAQQRDWIRQYADDPGKLLIVAETSGQIVGTLSMESGARKRLAHVGTVHLSVARNWRSRGVGSILLESAIDWARSCPNLEKLGLSVFSTNARAIGLYRKLGFVEEGRKSREVKLGIDRYVDDVLMYQFVKPPLRND